MLSYRPFTASLDWQFSRKYCWPKQAQVTIEAFLCCLLGIRAFLPKRIKPKSQPPREDTGKIRYLNQCHFLLVSLTSTHMPTTTDYKLFLIPLGICDKFDLSILVKWYFKQKWSTRPYYRPEIVWVVVLTLNFNGYWLGAHQFNVIFSPGTKINCIPQPSLQRGVAVSLRSRQWKLSIRDMHHSQGWLIKISPCRISSVLSLSNSFMHNSVGNHVLRWWGQNKKPGPWIITWRRRAHQ